MPTISVIVPVYNVENYLDRCVESILSQTFTDFELILVDDGSPDRSGAMCDEYAQKDSRIRVVHQENRGQAAARNHGVEIAKGEWISFVDSDDYVHPQMLEVLYRATVVGDSKMAIADGCAVCSDHVEMKTVSRDAKILIYNDMHSEETMWAIYMIPYAYWTPWCKLIHHSIVREFPFPIGRVFEDNAVIYRWLYSAGCISAIRTELYYYRQNDEGTTRSAFSLKKLDYLWVLEQQLEFYREKRYHKMSERLINDYLPVAADYYVKTKKVLHNAEKAAEIRRKAVSVFFENRGCISLSLSQIERCATRLESTKIKWWAFVRRVQNKLFRR